jgi:hypothetical protein
MRYRLPFLAGMAAGYVLGARAGRERYEQIKQAAQKLAGNPKVQQARNDLQQNAVHLFGSAKDKVSEKISDYERPSWIPGRQGRSEGEEIVDEGPGPVRTPSYATDDPWAAATQSDTPRH